MKQEEKYDPSEIEKKWPHSAKASRGKQEEVKYNPSQIESYWQEKWEQEKIYSPDLDHAKNPFYNLMMFPYPSAEGLHVGNMYAFTGSDIYGRYMRMKGYHVFEPIGLDGFGIHSENYALKVGRHPRQQAKVSEQNFYRQLHATGNAYDWTRKLETYDPAYYKWTQWIFIQLFKRGLAYRKKAPVNFCPKDKTVLADEQVINGKCERCGSVVEKRNLEQWFFKITEYAERLLKNIDTLNWTERVKIAQKNWIGKSEGARISFPVIATLSEAEGEAISVQKGIATDSLSPRNDNFSIEVFTTRPDTLFGATFLVVSPEHPFVAILLNSKLETRNSKLGEIKNYVAQAKKKTEQERMAEGKDKTGVFSGLYAINPVNNQEIPIWIADYVLMGYGTGAIMAVPAHDLRDFEFAKKYDLIIKPVIVPVFTQSMRDKDHEELLIKILEIADKNRKKVVIGGGWAADLHVGFRVRNHEDLDLYVPYEDVLWWKEQTENLGFVQKILDPKKDKRYYIEMSKEDNHPHYLWIDFVGIGVDEKGSLFDMEWGRKDSWPFKENDTVLKGELNGKQVYYFAPSIKKWYNFKVREKDRIDLAVTGLDCYTGEGRIINSGDLDNLIVPQALGKIIDWLEKKGIGKREVQYHLRDWLISRQRYWGPPIPMIYCDKCAQNGDSWFTESRHSGERQRLQNRFWTSQNDDWNSTGWYPVPEDQLPVLLPDVEDWRPEGSGTSPLANHPEFYKAICPNCGGEARRETDVSDTFLDSSWYFFRYLGTEFKDIPFPSEKYIKDQISPFDKAQGKNIKDKVKIENLKLKIENSARRAAWLPVHMYIGGAEHSVLHLLYSRFTAMVFHDMGLTHFEEPYQRFYAHGLLIKEGAKMSKSKGNIIVPDQYINKYGSDTLRCYLMFLGPFSQGGDFYDTGIEGMNRFVKRVWRLITESLDFVIASETKQSYLAKEIAASSASKRPPRNDNLIRLRFMHRTIKRVTEDIENLRYNTAIAALMEWYNFLSDQQSLTKEEIEIFLKLLAPFAPHTTEELWQRLYLVTASEARQSHKGIATSPMAPRNDKIESIHLQPWPVYDPKYLEEEMLTIVIQVNGKKRAELTLNYEQITMNTQIEEKARETVKKYLEGKTIKKTIYVPGKIVNFVV